MIDFSIQDRLFLQGFTAFNRHKFYDAHEYWEELWSDFRLKDAKFIQGLIQLSVGYFHISNFNRNGALGLLKKCENKFNEYKPYHRELDVDYILNKVEETIDYINKNPDLDLGDFDWELVPVLKKC